MLVTIRKMRQSDIPQVIGLGEKTPEIQTGSNLPQFYSYEQLVKWIKRRQSILMVAEVDKLLVGFYICDYNSAARQGYIEMVAINKEYRGQGIGKKLLQDTLRRLKKMGCEQVWCIVQSKNGQAQNLFVSSGFSAGKAFIVFEKELQSAP